MEEVQTVIKDITGSPWHGLGRSEKAPRESDNKVNTHLNMSQDEKQAELPRIWSWSVIKVFELTSLMSRKVTNIKASALKSLVCPYPLLCLI